jgi:hypothetical protein
MLKPGPTLVSEAADAVKAVIKSILWKEITIALT